MRDLRREREESERFARALDDPAEAGDFGAELAVIGGLRSLGAAGAPDAETKRRIRAEIVGRLAPPDEEPEPEHAPRMMTRVLVAAATVGIALGGLSMVMSKDALPGDALYTMKLAGEQAELGLTFGEQEKAEKHLEFATNRLNELSRLTPATPAFQEGLADFESEARQGVTQLTAFATANGGQVLLTQLRDWARQHTGRLAAADPTLMKVEQRATDLSGRLNCYQITTGLADELGMLPATGVCEPAPSKPPPDPGQPEQTPTVPTSVLTSTSSPSSGVARPTSASAPPSGTAVKPPPVVPPPILPTQFPPLPIPTTSQPPLISLPPLLPGLPPIIIP
ncbi:DUF5667 domain-containing protein [Amycolatopsis sp. cg5]|uniref:DUF5667 domain-containing protein n=1 Tax=Amycolatopsis sp. cg5 TaxID=3238802 RepID=UPI00352569DD